MTKEKDLAKGYRVSVKGDLPKDLSLRLSEIHALSILKASCSSSPPQLPTPGSASNSSPTKSRPKAKKSMKKSKGLSNHHL